jgi:hypothetical protein
MTCSAQHYVDDSGDFIQDVNLVHENPSAVLVDGEDAATVRRFSVFPFALIAILSRSLPISVMQSLRPLLSEAVQKSPKTRRPMIWSTLRATWTWTLPSYPLVSA